jgi:hypothetical protein
MTEAKETSIDPKDWALLALLSVLWGGILLLRRCCPAGVAAAFNCTRSRRLGGARARALDHPRRAANRIRCLESVHHHGGSQQRDPSLIVAGQREIASGLPRS